MEKSTSFIWRLQDRFGNRAIFLLLLLISFLFRLPFFFRDYVDRDESTFILVGQSWVDGHLPYTELWDIKPPLLFFFFAGIISVFGKSFFAIRAVGALLVATTAFFTYKLGTKVASKRTALVLGVACVALQSLFGSIQGVMSEHVGMVFLVPAIYIMVTRKTWPWLALAGLFMGISLMVKLNMAYTVLFLGLYLIYRFALEKRLAKNLAGILAYGCAILLVIALTCLPYYLEGLQALWWKSVVQAPLDYASARRASVLNMLPWFLSLSGFFYLAWRKKWLDVKNPSIQLLLVALIGVMYSFFKGGRINSHYLIQLYPVLLVLVGAVVGQMPFFKTFVMKRAYWWLLLLVPMESYLEYVNIAKHKLERGSFYNGEGITVPNYLQSNGLDSENILFLGYHIGYWVLGENPPTKAATHPSNIGKPEMFAAYDNPRKTAMEELRHIMEVVVPNTVVIRKNRSIFDPELVAENAYINARLKSHYAPPITVDKAEVFRLKKRP
ncbi:ArnT family glycosyltransferase [Maribacter sp. 2307ULW6-5]|uniref:ArnT family glycosyltransferase n=1 Tax=Maribacter sp. 2307ULW6-5 TaxID=3386275 RepID=UPI0039BD85AB